MAAEAVQQIRAGFQGGKEIQPAVGPKGPKVPKDGGFDEEPSYTPPKAEPPKMKSTPWTEAEEQFHQEPEPQAPEVPQAEPPAEPAPVTLEWKSAFNVEKYEKELQEKQEADHDGR